jgi:glycogen debranching enzyme
LKAEGSRWVLELPLAEVGYFKAKAYLVDPQGWQHWPEGPDVGIAVHPDRHRTANVIYCAFTRMFEQTRPGWKRAPSGSSLEALDKAGYTVIPASGTLRDLGRQLPHIIDRLGCRIVHLLPVTPTPTTYARFGRFGSPYAVLDLSGIDLALAEFDRRTTGVDQFQELTFQAHRYGARIFLDIVINHTGWGSVFQENHPEWFVREEGSFTSPGAWGVVWEDLVELKHQHVSLWDELAAVFLTWCRRGVDGFRCDAGYKVPVAAWQYIVARVQQEFPETIFLLEGLGGAWEATEALLTEGGMQWAYSELFQNYSAEQVAGYLGHSLVQSERTGILVHYSETHDNDRLAARGRAWSLLRNRLCALASVSGGFGFTCGVEWLATEKIKVHGSTDMAWGNEKNLVVELGTLNRLLADHPCFFDGALSTRLSAVDSPIFALHRQSSEGKDAVLVLVNTDVATTHSTSLEWDAKRFGAIEFPGVTFVRADTLVGVQKAHRKPAPGRPQQAGSPVQGTSTWVDLLGQRLPEFSSGPGGKLQVNLAAGAAYCLAPTAVPRGLAGDAYRQARARAAWAFTSYAQVAPVETVGQIDWRALADAVHRAPAKVLAAISAGDLANCLREPDCSDTFPCVITWSLLDHRRVTPVPPGHWLLLEDASPFRASLSSTDGGSSENVESIAVLDGYIACFSPRHPAGAAALKLERYADRDQHLQAAVQFLAAEPVMSLDMPRFGDLVLLTNGRGGMGRMCVDLGRVQSKYDCVLGASLHPTLPVDRHILVKRIRVWVSADGFISPLDLRSLTAFDPGPPAVWHFTANAGDGRTVEIQIAADMLEGRNTTIFHFSRPTAAQATGKQLPAQADVRLTVRLDLEDRNFHWETKRNGGAEHHFHSNVRTLGTKPGQGEVGFAFTPAADRQLRAVASAGSYYPQPEWSENIPHPVEQSRGQTGSGDAFSPGWFDLPLPKGASLTVVVTAELSATPNETFGNHTKPAPSVLSRSASVEDPLGQQLFRAMRAFVVRRDAGKTVIAGYPWFLDWGRDTFICARGLLAAGLVADVKQIAITFARFEREGTLPNTIFGSDASNRDTSDAPLWFALVCEELAGGFPGVHSASGPEFPGSALYETQMEPGGRTLQHVLKSIAQHYETGTPNGIHMDRGSGLIWSPSHFTWMDTNYPAGSPREGYPVEIQVLWIRLLRQLAVICSGPDRRHWDELARQAAASFEALFWRENVGYYADVLLAKQGQVAKDAMVDDALRSNCLFAVSLGLAKGTRAQRCVRAAQRYLVVPGGLRSLAPLPVSVPLPIVGLGGSPLNDPKNPYWGRYEGDEDTRRKPAYHNGTAWTWTLPVFCEALARAWDFSPVAVSAARAYLGSMAQLMARGCVGHLPEILDGDAPHTQRGCDAQAWSATEALRVWRLLNEQRQR